MRFVAEICPLCQRHGHMIAYSGKKKIMSSFECGSRVTFEKTIQDWVLREWMSIDEAKSEMEKIKNSQIAMTEGYISSDVRQLVTDLNNAQSISDRRALFAHALFN